MKVFNDNEKAILEYLVAQADNGIVSMKSVLEGFYFLESKGRALIIQTQSQKAVLFLLSEIYNSENGRKNEIREFFELISLLVYLKKEGYLSLFKGPETRKKPIFFIQDNFLDPTPTTGPMVLNAKGDYTSAPDTIHDKNKLIKYNGITFDFDTYDMISEVAVGTVYCSADMRNLINNKPVEEADSGKVSYYLPAEVGPGKQKQSTKHLIIGIGTAVLSLLLFVLIYFKIEKSENNIRAFSDNSEQLNAKLAGIIAARGNDSSRSGQEVSPSVLPDTGSLHYGIDVSHWNGNLVAGDLLPDSLTFAICKATDGINDVDNYFHRNWSAIKEKRLIRGAYHFFRSVHNPISQAEFYLRQLQQFDTADFAPIVDIEDLSLQNDTINADKINLQVNVLMFLQHVESKTNRVPIIYTNYYFASKYLTNPSFARYPLWLADYPKSGPPKVPVIWKEKGYKIWQKSPKYHINAENVDLDVYVGKKQDIIR